MRLDRVSLALCSVVLASASLSARADTISGAAYCNMPTMNTPDPGSNYGGTLCATFQTNGINFATDGNGGRDTLGWFLDTGSTVPGSVTYQPGYDPSSSFVDTLYTFSGQAYFSNGAQYTVTHDDGVVMQVNGVTVFSSPSATPPTTDTFIYTGLSGTYDFAFNYTQDSGGAVFYTNAADSPVPESGSLVLVLIGMGMVATTGALRHWKGRGQAEQDEMKSFAL